jgi:hypothetical protein
MLPRIGIDLEPGIQIARTLTDLDLLDCAYGATRGGARGTLVPISAFVGSLAYSPELFHRPGLPVFTVKTEIDDLDRIPGLGSAPDRILVTGDRGRSLSDLGRIADMMARITASGQENAVLVDPEPAAIKEASRAKAQWVFFSTEPAYHAAGPDAAQDELGRLTSAALAANKLNLRVGLIGPVGRQLPFALRSIAFCEEIFPTPDVWSLALRLGWEGALREFRELMT